MLLHKISSLITVVAIIFAFIGATYFTATSVHALQLAQPVADPATGSRMMPLPGTMQDSTPSQCPIDGFAIAEIDANEKITIDSELIATINLQNTSQFVLGGVRVGLGVYSTKSQLVPDYWFVSEQSTLAAGQTTELQLQIDASIMPAGEYILRSFTMQGGAAEVLGAITRGASDDSAQLVKVAPAASQVSIGVTVNGTVSNGQTIVVADGENIEVAVATKNNNSVPLINSTMVAVISQGDVPLGAAVREMTVDSVKLVPGGTRNTQLTDRFTETGKYSVYAGLVTENTFQPIEYAPLNLGDEVATQSWAYLSKIGVNTEGLVPESEMVGCFNYIGENAESASLQETLGLEIKISNGEAIVSTTEVRTDATPGKTFVSIQPGITLEKALVTATLLQERFSSVIGAEGVGSLEVDGETEMFLTPVQSASFTLECVNIEGCGVDNEQAPVSSQGLLDTDGGNSFYFYAAIVIAAALLLYIMLRRLHPEEDSLKENNSNELQ